MKTKLSSYLNEYCHASIGRDTIFENIKNRDIDKAIKLMGDFLKKRNIYTIPVIEIVNVGTFASFMVLAFTNNNTGCAFVWRREDTAYIHEILFTKDFDTAYANISNHESAEWDIDVQLKGASVARTLQLVSDVLTGKTGMDKASLNKAVRDAQIWESETDELENTINESTDPVIANIERKKNSLYQRIRDKKKKGLDTSDLEKEYEELKQQLIDARVSVKQGTKVTPITDPVVKKIESRFFEEERALPGERFEDMESYVLNVILGLDTCALICGAPGVGKTYRIMQAIKKEAKVRGRDYEVIKGKITPLKLYTMLHDFQKKGQILVIDDADSALTDDTNIQLIKAATDSSDERIVAYASSTMPLVPEDMIPEFNDWDQDAKGRWVYPKNFVYEGSIIIITNMNAGQIDTAIRSRALICDLNFTTDEVISLVEKLSPHIMPEVLTPESKEKAITYLKELAEQTTEIEISIRTFTMLAKMMMSDAPEQAIKRRIREQLKLKFLRGGKKY